MQTLVSLFPMAHRRYAELPVLGGILDGLCQWLEVRGYTPDALRRRVEGAPLLDEALRNARIFSLSECTRDELLSCRPTPARWTAHVAGSLCRSLAQYLGEQGVLLPEPLSSTDLLVSAYGQYVSRVRGLEKTTVNHHTAVAKEFLAFLQYDGDEQKLQKLGAAEIDSFLVEASRHRCRVSMQHVTARLRSFLRFLATEGMTVTDLDQSVDSPRRYRGERLPRALPWQSVLTLLKTIDRSTNKGKRDYAIFLLVTTYGLRASEIAALRLDDFAWRERQIRLPRPKVGTTLLLPLTDEVAAALVDYLQHSRPHLPCREVFLRMRVPGGPITANAVNDAFQAWTGKAGIELPERGGPHCLRHTLAMQLLRQGTQLKAIGDLLGHRSAESTCIYLRLNIDDLRDVALSLPITFTEVQP